MKRVFALLLTMTFLWSMVSFTHPDQVGGISIPQAQNQGSGGTVNIPTDPISVKVAAADDKILQSYDTSSTAGKKLKAKYESLLTDQIRIAAAKNEYESKQLILQPSVDLKAYTVEVSDLASGSHRISKDNIALYHEYYHAINTIYDDESEMIAGMYPDALIPMDVAIANGLNTVKAGNNQGVYVTLYIPKDTPAGTYTGTATVTANGTGKTSVAISVTVYDYTLPDGVSMTTCIPQQIGYMFNGELNDTDEMYQKYVDALKEYRLAVQYLNPHLLGSQQDVEGLKNILAKEIKLVTEAAQDPGVSGYGIRVYEKWNEGQGAYILNEDLFEAYLVAYVDGSIASGVDLLAKAYVYMGNIIDEPDLGGAAAIQRANYVCGQFDSVVASVIAYAKNAGASAEVVDSLRNLRHVVTGRYSDALTGPQTYCPTADVLDTDYMVDVYQSLKVAGKSYWWYTCTLPKIPYPTYHIDDNAVSSRVMFWMASAYGISGYLTWEDIFYRKVGINGVTTPTKGMDCYDDIHRWSDAYGDGFLFYPGKPLGMNAPVASLRLSTMRDGLEEYEELKHLMDMYAELSQTYGVAFDAKDVLNELYGTLFTNAKVFCTSDETQKAHTLLLELCELASRGVAIAELKVTNGGAVSAKVYAPAGLSLSVNGTAQTGSVEGAGRVYTFAPADGSFTLGVGARTYALIAPKTEMIHTFTAGELSLYDARQNPVGTSATMTSVGGVNMATMPIDLDACRLTLSVSGNNLTVSDGSILLYVYSTGDAKVSLTVQGNGKNRLVETFAIHEGENILRVDRLEDFEFSALKTIDYIHLSITTEEHFSLSVYEVVKMK